MLIAGDYALYVLVLCSLLLDIWPKGNFSHQALDVYYEQLMDCCFAK